jgi:hypothetical protein
MNTPLTGVSDDVIKADPRLIPTGPNNALITKVKFEVGQADYNLAYITLTDSTSSRYSIPDKMANRAATNPTMRLDMCGFEYFTNPFGFEFSKGSDTVISTKDSALIMYDKYI